MPFKKGSKKIPHSGRKKGTPNKSTFDAKKIADELGVDPFRILLHIASGNWKELGLSGAERCTSAVGRKVMEPTIPVPTRERAASSASRFLMPELKAIDHGGDAAKAVNTLAEVLRNAARNNPDNGKGSKSGS